MVISKKDMALVARKAAQSAPSIEDRIQQAQKLAAHHPIDETGIFNLQSSPSIGPMSIHDKFTDASTHGKAAPYFLEVEIDKIDTNPFNARHVYRPERAAEITASIAVHGQEVPGIATLRGDRYILGAGHYRLGALKTLGKHVMGVMIHLDLTDRELYEISFRENAEREGQSSLDNAMSWRDLLNKGVYENETAIANATGMSLSNVNKTLKALFLSKPVLELIKESPTDFALSSLYELALYEEVAGPEKTLIMAQMIKTGDAGRKEIQEARARVETPKDRKRKETSRQYKIQSEGSQIGLLKEWDSGRVALEISITDPDERAKVIADLRVRFGAQ